MDLNILKLNTKLEIHEIFNIWRNDKEVILLDSSKPESPYSEFSFIGINPFLTFKSKGESVFIDEEKINGSAFSILKELLNKYKFESSLEFPLAAGAIGYFSYDMCRKSNKLYSKLIDDVEIYDSYFRFYNNIIIFNHKTGDKYVTSVNGKKSAEEIKNLVEDYVLESNYDNYTYNNDFTKFKSNFNKFQYMNAVSKTKKYIKKGHTYIANMTQRFECESLEDNYDIYLKLRNINPAPFSAYMSFDDFSVISSSPERFIQITDKLVKTRPIKGTMPRGKDKYEDDLNKSILINSEKDKSELLMVVDLERNDLSKVCKPWSVKVTELFSIEEYATVFHLVSEIQGVLDDNNTSIDCIRECFPGGSITGTPKIRTMEIIDELEGLKRGLYTGSIGYFDFRGNCDFNIVIRTIVKKGSNAYFGVGGGITIESDEESEYNETLDKAKALMQVL